MEKTFDDYLKASPSERRKMNMSEILGEERLAKTKEQMSLEEAAEKSSAQYYKDAGYSPFPNVETAAHKSGFIAGAEWQKQHDAELIEIAYNDGITIGMTKQKEKMLKDAVEGRIGAVGLHNSIFIKEPEWAERLDRLNGGDKVRIIIVKEEG